MKKIITAFCILFALLTACVSGDKDKYLIGVSQCSDDLWRTTVNNEICREASFYQDMTVDIRSVKDNTQQQIKDIESFIEAGVNLIIVSPNEASTLRPAIQKALQANIPVILLDRKIDTKDYTAFVGADNYRLAYELGQYAANVLKGRGNVVVIRGFKGATADTERYKGFTNAIANYPKIKIADERYCNFLKEVANREMAEIIKTNDKIDLIFAMNDQMAFGVSEAFNNYEARPFIIGIDALPGPGGGIEGIENGLIDASFTYPTGGGKVVELAHKILSGEPFDKENILYTYAVDKSNARILQLQSEQIIGQQDKFDNVNSLLNKSLAQYSNQQTLFYISLLASLLFIIIIVLESRINKQKSRANALLEKQNKEIRQQAEELTIQKKQLIDLSEQLHEATHAKLVFFTNISHEFKTPLSLIVGPVNTLLSEGNLTKDQIEMLDLIKRNSNRLLQLISEIIEFRSYENGMMKTHFTLDNLNLFLEDLNPLFNGYEKQKKAKLQFVAEDSSFEMIFDKEKVEKIYFNLISNAFKHVNEGGKVTASLVHKQMEAVDYVQLSVHNSGSYIPPDERRKIFDRFYKIDNLDGNTGIGLALVSTLVDIHHGTIDLESDKISGTTFHVLLPTQQAIEIEEVPAIFDTESGYIQRHIENEIFLNTSAVLPQHFENSNKPIILLIEDNDDMRSFMLHILKEEYNVVEAENGERGIEKAIKYIPDLIISDVTMPVKDGFEVCKILKENITTSYIPIILLTACSLDEQKAIGFESGADAYIPKPFNADLLKIRIRKLIEIRTKMKEAFGKNIVDNTKKTTLAEKEQKFIDHFTDYIENQISNPEMNVDDIAKSIGMSRVQLYRKMKSLTGFSPNEMVKIVRLKYALQLLSLRTKSISEVAYESGFSSPSYFTKCFKEFYDKSPTDFLQRENY